MADPPGRQRRGRASVCAGTAAAAALLTCEALEELGRRVQRPGAVASGLQDVGVEGRQLAAVGNGDVAVRVLLQARIQRPLRGHVQRCRGQGGQGKG